jgi:hypothetical protein
MMLLCDPIIRTKSPQFFVTYVSGKQVMVVDKN